MTYIPHTANERQQMLARIGVERLEDLFDAIPAGYRFPAVDLPDPISELEILEELRMYASSNENLQDTPSFLGAGAYHHFIPSVVNHVIGRSEFYTAYTPYQPELSQGTLQAIFEYQTMICALTGMEVSNASHYDGATALAEAVIMAHTVARGRRHKVVMTRSVHPEYRQTVRTYTQGMDLVVVGDESTSYDLKSALDLLDTDTSCLIVQTPDFFGRIHDLEHVAQVTHAVRALVVVVTYPIALGMLRPPGDFGADIVVGEGQSLGNSLSFGGPYLGFFACRQEHVRRMAGRLVGQTNDIGGERGYVLTLSTREQHIRRERATSNICTNEGLVALAAAVYMAALGKCGLTQVASLCYHKAHHAAAEIAQLDGYRVDQATPFFNEFVVECPRQVSEINRFLLDEAGIIGGYDLSLVFPEMERRMLLCLTEMNNSAQIDRLLLGLEEAAT
ncbi:MAG: aminomethyl-transferring glycine dehydrogenase subunit GcvPA [Lysobacterales bacterium]|nr:MAG: aminomethyl-transferring glycine dehydrogenase subunit GcvPA [Xanthomonadales bacterium]